jgi:cytochrome c biogenesis protein CcmG, thiol:disulfide interchange protein DsbE
MSNWGTMSYRTVSTVQRWAALFPAALATLVLMPAALAASSEMIGKPAPDFGLAAVAGDNVRLSEYRGQPVIVSFWSSSCSTCSRQLAVLDKLYATYRSSGLIVLGVSVDDNLVRAREYAHARAISFPLLLDVQKSAGRDFLIDRLPTAVLIDRRGVIRYIHSDDGADQRSYVVQIRTLLDDKPAVP